MADYAPPTGPPPPKVPEGWKAVYNEQYHEWFYVNTYTKQSQWDRPTEPIYAPPGEGAPPGAPPGYDHSTSQHTTEKSNNPFMQNQQNQYNGGGQMNETSDEAYARKLQEEENARASGSRGASDNYYQGPQAPQYGQGSNQSYDQQQLPQRDQKKSGGLLSKLTSKLGSSGGSSSRPQYGGYPQGGMGGYPQQQGYGHGPQMMGGHGYGQPGYGQPYGGGYGGGYGGYGGGGYPPRKSGGMGAGGGAALGLGAGLLGGALIAESFDDDGGGGDDGGGDDGGGE
ncbi:WW domain-containing protein wwm1 [Extremus antarcticus]|uniref:WW domain-containing protein wwm1 n=1 Tax=Extremus antarcticus TaxID=702011 RepID=A0AAJ0GEK9_9PEZI|nr:WW domain-containing protein wwm1 [Extremus antarcticus]